MVPSTKRDREHMPPTLIAAEQMVNVWYCPSGWHEVRSLHTDGAGDAAHLLELRKALIFGIGPRLGFTHHDRGPVYARHVLRLCVG